MIRKNSGSFEPITHEQRKLNSKTKSQPSLETTIIGFRSSLQRIGR